MKNNIYTSGEYLSTTSTWHTEDSSWKARGIMDILKKNKIEFRSVLDIGCGTGEILNQLSKEIHGDVSYTGIDISPQAIEIAKKHCNRNIKYFVSDSLAKNAEFYADVLLIIDVFEHVPDYVGFIEQCRRYARYKLFHIPLDLHVSALIRNTFMSDRYTVGHIHYFSSDSAIASLKDSGMNVIDYSFTNAAMDLFFVHPSFKKALANAPRWLISKISVPLSARIMGGYSLMVLAE